MRPYETKRFYEDTMPSEPRARRIVRRNMKRSDKAKALKAELLAEEQAFDAEMKELDDYWDDFESERHPLDSGNAGDRLLMALFGSDEPDYYAQDDCFIPDSSRGNDSDLDWWFYED